ncbi:nucleotidyltransferase family protein [Dryocola sp. BD626]|uniref:nucleotidyltransferase family protein n=1 Tax=Dryocola sp. BD626 TaxID=3133273 RepID=UPI003F5014A6
MKPGILIAAAGLGERFTRAGGVGHKLNATLAGGSVFEQTLGHALASGLAVHVVTRPENQQVQHACAARGVSFTPVASPGLGDTLAAGVAATSRWNGWLLHLADMPFVPACAFVQIADALAQHSIVRPRVDGQPGHPVGFSSAWRDKLVALTGDSGARELLRGQPVRFIDFDNSALLRDIDLPSQLFSESNDDYAAS